MRQKPGKAALEIYWLDMFDVFIGSGFSTIAVLFLPDLGRDFHQSGGPGRLVVATLSRFFYEKKSEGGWTSGQIFKYVLVAVIV